MRSALHTGAKILLIGLIAALVIPLAVPVASGQRTADTAIIDLGGAETTPPGATYQLSITGRDLANLAALSAVLHFENDKFSFRSATVTEGRKGFLLSHNLHIHEPDVVCVEPAHAHNTCTHDDAEYGELRLSFAGSKGLQGDQDLITIIFETIGPNGDAGLFQLEALQAFSDDEQSLDTSPTAESRIGYKRVQIYLPRVSHRLPAKGDVNGDGKLRVDDVLRLLRSEVKRITLSPNELYAADVGPLSAQSCGDGRVGLADAQWILKATSGVADLTPCGNPSMVFGALERSSVPASGRLPDGQLDTSNGNFGISETLVRQANIEQEHLDLFGASLAGVHNNSGRDWLVIGSPGESVAGRTGRARGKVYLLKDPGLPLGGTVVECIIDLPTNCLSRFGDKQDAAWGTSVGFGFPLPPILGAVQGDTQEQGALIVGLGGMPTNNRNSIERVFSLNPQVVNLDFQLSDDGHGYAPAHDYPRQHPPGTGIGSVITTGDFNGDQNDDIAVGAPSYPTRDPFVIYGAAPIAVGANGSARRSLDGDFTFNTLLGGANVKKIAMSTGFNTDGTMFSVGDTESAFFKTENFGDVWSEIQLAPGVPFNTGSSKLTAIAMSKDYLSDQTLLVGTKTIDGGVVTSGSGISRSSNGGKSWAASNDGLDSNDLNIRALATAKPRIAFLATERGTFASSTDAGLSWTTTPWWKLWETTPSVNDIEPMPNYGTWPSNKKAGGTCTNCFAGSGIWLATDLGLRVSLNQGVTWEAVGPTGTEVLDVAISPHHIKKNPVGKEWVLFAGTSNGILRAAIKTNPNLEDIEDAAWDLVFTGRTVYEIAVSALFRQDGTAFAATSGGLYKTIDHGLTWSKTNTSQPFLSQTVAISQRTPAGAVTIFDGGSKRYESADKMLFDLEPAGSKSSPFATDPFNGRKGDRFGHSLAAGDFNCDGYDDLAVGNPYEDHVEENDGVVFIMHGSPTGLSEPDWFISHSKDESYFTIDLKDGQIAGPTAGALFGYSLASGDLNGDGCSDLAVGAPRSGSNSAGKAEVFLGNRKGLRSASVVDNGALKQPRSLFGFSVAIGDMDGDGNDDLAVGAPFYDSRRPLDNQFRKDAGLVRIYLTGETTWSEWNYQYAIPPDEAAPGQWPLAVAGSAYDRYGYALAFADLDNDGRKELAAGAPFKALPGGPTVQKRASSNLRNYPQIRPGQPGLPTDGGAVFILDLTSKALAKPLPWIGVQRPTAPITRNVVAFLHRRADGENPDQLASGRHVSTGTEPLTFLTEEWEALLEDTLNWDQLEINHHRIQYKIHFVDAILDDPLTKGDSHATCKAAGVNSRQCQFSHLLEELDKQSLLPPVTEIENSDGVIRVWTQGTEIGGSFPIKKPSSWTNSKQSIYMASDRLGIGHYNLRYVLEASSVHELGHVLDNLPDHYGNPFTASTTISANPWSGSGGGTHIWDRMSHGNFRHNLGWYNHIQYFLGTGPQGNSESLNISPGTGTLQPNGSFRTEVVLAPSASFSPGHYQLINVECPGPLEYNDSGKANLLSIEFRKQIGADETLADEGLLITKVYAAPGAESGIGTMPSWQSAAAGLAWIVPRALSDAGPNISGATEEFPDGSPSLARRFLARNATLPWSEITDFFENPSIENAWTTQWATPDADVRIFAAPEVDPVNLALTGNVVVTIDVRPPTPGARPQDTCRGYLTEFMTPDQMTDWTTNWNSYF